MCGGLNSPSPLMGEGGEGVTRAARIFPWSRGPGPSFFDTDEHGCTQINLSTCLREAGASLRRRQVRVHPCPSVFKSIDGATKSARSRRLPSIGPLVPALPIAFLLAIGQDAPASEPPPLRETTIAQARAAASGEAVSVTGVVTVPSGAFASSLSAGFAIQDGTAGIYVLDTSHAFELGDRVRVTGRRGAEFQQRHIRLESAQKLPGSGTVEPRPVRTGRVGEAEEGTLIRAAGRIERVEDDAPYGHKIFIDDGSGELQVFIDASTALIEDVTRWQPGDTIDVTGFAGRYEETHEIMPRIPSDMSRQAAE